MPQLEHIEAIERRLWSAAGTLRANSTYASNEYFLPVMGLVFLRHAYSRYLAVRDDIVAGLPSRGGVARPLTKEDFSQRSTIFLRPEAQFDYLVALTDADDRDRAIIAAMESIEADYDNLQASRIFSRQSDGLAKARDLLLPRLMIDPRTALQNLHLVKDAQ